MSGRINRVLFVIAMEAEAKPFVEALGLSELASPLAGLPAQAFQGDAHGLSVTVVMNGKHPSHGVDCVGTVGAAVVTYAAIQAFKPDLVVNAGTAGGFQRKGAAIGDVFVATAFANHDRRIPIPGFEAYGTGKRDATPVEKLYGELGWKTGVVTTSNSLDHNADDDERMLANDASVKDMEAAAIADVAAMADTPLVSIKVVTDIVDGDRPTQEEFLENLGTAAARLQSALPEALQFISGKSVGEL